MRTHGTLTRWNDDRGFGFITTPKGEEIFVHIKAFPRGERPQVGELISFETEVDNRNRTRAVRVMRPGQTVSRRSVRDDGHERRERHEHQGRRYYSPRRSRGSWIALTMVAMAAIYGYSRLADNNNSASYAPPMTLTEDEPVERTSPAPRYQCDGRTRCTEMRSCEEARFFLRKCAGSAMDGDGDGIPCEDQWCGH